LKMTGGGPGTKIRAPNSQAAFVFLSCKAVEVADLHVEAGKTGGRRGPDKLKGAGVLTFHNCRSVTVTGVSLQGAEALALATPTIRTASCIEVLGNSATAAGLLQAPSCVRIAHNDLTVARLQEGIVIADMDRVQVEDNILTAIPTPNPIPLEK